MKTPQIHPSTFVAPNATILGNVMIGKESGIFFGAVIRSESSPITIGDRTNIQDNCILHIDEEFPLVVGKDCTIGHGAILHGCTIGDNTLVGMGAVVLNGAVIGRDCIVGAGALVPQGAVIPDGTMVLGMPAKVRRAVTEEEKAANTDSARRYKEEAAHYIAYFAQK